ncbi:putative START-like domain-containing protein [Lupinus albus]|uniref:Putative START-like domain-containing protein n=1 Tax=Lupinus albus TaxID=3870 RepID=A0A6A4QWA7_LUPAL|nr:putative START-like domain-containing protein [Lupinus albus]
MMLPPTQPTLEQDVVCIGAALNQNISTLNQNISTLGQDVPNFTFGPALNQDISISVQDISYPTFGPTLNQGISTIRQDIPNPTFCPALNQNIPTLVQDISYPTFGPTLNQSISTLRQDIPKHAFGLALNQDISTPVQDIPCPTFGPTLNQNISTLSQDVPNSTFDPTLNQDISTSVQDISYPTFGHTLNQGISTLCQDIPNPTFGPALNQNIPTPVQDILYPTFGPTINQGISTLPQDIPKPTFGVSVNQDISTPVQNISYPTFGPTRNQNISTLRQDIPKPTFDPALNQNISTPGQYSGSGYAMQGVSNADMLPHTMNTTSADDVEKAMMAEVSVTAMEELLKLLIMNEPLWLRPVPYGKCILQRECYERIFHRRNRFKGPYAHLETSRYSKTVNMSVTQLFDMFLDAEKWVALFPTIVKKAKTIQVLQNGLSGHLQLMYAEIHSLSPLVPTRKFIFLRFCKQVEHETWAIGDVSFDASNHSTALYQTWKLPSGCLIKKLTHDSSNVTWVEHVEVDDKNKTHQLFTELMCGNFVYGAERWVLTLERMCQRYAQASILPNCNEEEVIDLLRGSRSLMDLAQHMVKIFCGSLDMSENVDLTQHLTKVNMNNSNSETRVSVRNNTIPGVPDGIILSVAKSFWINLPPQTVIDFLNDSSKRNQWDILCEENPIVEIQRISTGTNPHNFTSILQVVQPTIQKMENMVILQESCVDDLGGLLVYAPLTMKLMNDVMMKGEQCSVLPYGFTISKDGRSNNGVGESSSGHIGELEGSLVTLLIQTLVCTPSSVGQFNMEKVASVNEMAESIEEKIRVSLSSFQTN